jgi:hypothetical protein
MLNEALRADPFAACTPARRAVETVPPESAVESRRPDSLVENGSAAVSLKHCGAAPLPARAYHTAAGAGPAPTGAACSGWAIRANASN